MKIYASRRHTKYNELQKFASKDVWVRATIEDDDCYVLINYVTETYVSLYALDLPFITALCDPYFRDYLAQYLEILKDNKRRKELLGQFAIQDVAIFPHKGVYTMLELEELLKKYQIRDNL